MDEDDNKKRTPEILASASKNKLFHEDKEGVEPPLLNKIRNLIITARKTAAQNINTLQVITNFEIGRIIVAWQFAKQQKIFNGERFGFRSYAD